MRYLDELINNINFNYFVFYSNLNDAYLKQSITTESFDFEEDIEDSYDMYLLESKSKDYLHKLSVDEINNIKNFELLDRVVSIGRKEDLTADQLRILEREYSKKFQITRSSITKLLNKFTKCNRLFIDNNKPQDFITKYNLRENDLLKMIHSLSLSDCYFNTHSGSFNKLRNNLIIFKKRFILSDEDESKNVDVEILIKLDIDETTKDGIALISMSHFGASSNK